MSSYKIVAYPTDKTPEWYHAKPNRQWKKRVYVSEADFIKYSTETIKRWLNLGMQVKTYIMRHSEWELKESRI